MAVRLPRGPPRAPGDHLVCAREVYRSGELPGSLAGSCAPDPGVSSCTDVYLDETTGPPCQALEGSPATHTIRLPLVPGARRTYVGQCPWCKAPRLRVTDGGAVFTPMFFGGGCKRTGAAHWLQAERRAE